MEIIVREGIEIKSIHEGKYSYVEIRHKKEKFEINIADNGKLLIRATNGYLAVHPIVSNVIEIESRPIGD